MNALKLNDLIIERAGLSPEELQTMTDLRQGDGKSLGQTLVQQKKLTESQLLEIFSEIFGLPVMRSIAEDRLDFALVQKVPISYLKKHLAVPYREKDGTIFVAMADPLKAEIVDDFLILFPEDRVKPILAPAAEIISAINLTFGQAEDRPDEIIHDLGLEDKSLFAELEQAQSSDLLDETSNAPIIKLVNRVIGQAVKTEASDIHIEPYASELKIRFRLDGVLHNVLTLPRRLHPAVISRLKIMARLNIAEKRLPQDGRIEIKIGNRAVDLRISTLPTGFGERVVMRLLEKNVRLLSMKELGLMPDHLEQLEGILQTSNGIVLVTGPTGSGKTTTLYAALSSINSPDKNILTIEDPVEYQIDGIGQMQVNPKIDLTFARALRSMVRQDPDVILVGEIRDLETAEIAIQAALTGHMVFSTLHTNDAASAVTRMIDMGVEPFLVSSSVRAIIAQRLIRVLCPACKEAFTPSDKELAELKLHGRNMVDKIYRAVGCSQCLETGYRGRTAIYEFLRVTEKMQDLIIKTSDANQIRQLAITEGMLTLRDDGLRKVLQGATTIDEVLRVTLL
jgi:general secretion pathway protein E